MKLKIAIPETRLKTMLDGIISEGVEVVGDAHLNQALAATKSVDVLVGKDKAPTTFTRAKLSAALVLLAQKHPALFGQLLSSEPLGAEVGETVLKLALL